MHTVSECGRAKSRSHLLLCALKNMCVTHFTPPRSSPVLVSVVCVVSVSVFLLRVHCIRMRSGEKSPPLAPILKGDTALCRPPQASIMRTIQALSPRITASQPSVKSRDPDSAAASLFGSAVSWFPQHSDICALFVLCVWEGRGGGGRVAFVSCLPSVDTSMDSSDGSSHPVVLMKTLRAPNSPIVRALLNMSDPSESNFHPSFLLRRGSKHRMTERERDDLSGIIPPVGPCHSTPQSQDQMKHTDCNKVYLSTIPCPVRKSHRPDCTCLRSPRGPSFPQTRTGSRQSSIQHWSSVFQLLTCLQTAQYTEAQGIPQILSSRIVTRSIKLSLTFVWHVGAHRKPSSISLPLFSTSILCGISLVYLKFSTRDILLQMYPPGIQHTPKDTSEHIGALFLT